MGNIFGYQDKVVVVTGVASGMGLATAKILVELGAKVYGLDRTPVSIDGMVAFVAVDLAQKESIDQAFQELPEQIDAFFGIAGVSGLKTDFVTTYNINFTANKYMTDVYLSKRVRDGGTLNFITSTAGLGWEVKENIAEYIAAVEADNWEATVDELARVQALGADGSAAYNLSKRAMNYFIQTKLNEFGSRQIRLNAVLPGITNTGLTQEFGDSFGGKENLVSITGAAQRIPEAVEMAWPIVFMGSQLASFVNGELLQVDYGFANSTKLGIAEDDVYSRQILAED